MKFKVFKRGREAGTPPFTSAGGFTSCHHSAIKKIDPIDLDPYTPHAAFRKE